MSTVSDLVAALSARSEPALVWVSDSGNLELTGRVAANWVYKSAGLLTESGLDASQTLLIVCPDTESLHWRALTAAIAAWSLGASVTFALPQDTPPDTPHLGLAPDDLTEAPVLADADDVFVYATPALALRAEAPVGFRDFNSEVRTHPDVQPLPPTSVITVDGGAATGSMASVEPPRAQTTALIRRPADAAAAASALSSLAGGQLALTDAADEASFVRLSDGVLSVHVTIGEWTK